MEHYTDAPIRILIPPPQVRAVPMRSFFTFPHTPVIINLVNNECYVFMRV